MKIYLAACIVTLVTFVVAENEVEEEPKGYHVLVGIPAAKRIYKSETTTSPEESKVKSTSSLGAHPYLAGVVITVGKYYSVCGSSLLDNNHAITAAHCWWDGWYQAVSFTMVFGSEYIFVGGTRIKTRLVKTHPKWDPLSLNNDLAIVVFSHIGYNDFIQPIALPIGLTFNKFIGYWVQASGYGKSGPGRVQQNQMETDVVMKVITTEDCINETFEFMANTICATAEDLVSKCISHSGGPLTTIHNNKRYLIGVASFGDYDCESEMRSGYVRVTSYLYWIQSRLK